MPFSKARCPICNKVFDPVQTFSLQGRDVLKGKCGHFVDRHSVVRATNDISTFESLDGKRPFPFQVETIRHMEQSGGRDLIAHEMGLGKTVCVEGFLATHPECMPFLAVVKSSLLTQWQHETMRWQGEDVFVQILDSSKTMPLKGMKGYLVSYDLLRRLKDFPEKMKELGVKMLILDEVQQIKNLESERTQAVLKLAKDFEYIFGLSGTPIKNRASEFYPILHILQPERFNNYSRFLKWDCDAYHNGYTHVVGGLRDPKAFMESTKKFITRVTRAEVKDEIGMEHDQANRVFQFHELSKECEKLYEIHFKQFRDEFNSMNGGNSFEESGNILAFLSKMRHVAGLSLIDPVLDHVIDHIESTERKIVVFVHHKDVGETLAFKLKRKGIRTLMLTADLDREKRARVVDEFNANDSLVMIASTLSSGEGLNLQTCCDCVVMERQWNPANEEQAEARFIRIGQKNAVTATYFIAVGTVVEFFSEIVERKREIVNSTLNGEAVKWDQSSLMKELSETLAASGGKHWSW